MRVCDARAIYIIARGARARWMGRSYFTPIMVLFTMAFSAVVFMDRICHMHAEYMKQVSKMEQDARMLVICRNATHKDVLSSYTSVCLELESNARIGPFMLALNTVTGGEHFQGAANEVMHSLRALGWPFLVLAAAVFLVCPSLVINGMRSRGLDGPLPWRAPKGMHEHQA
jgi:hypothetical protein